MKTKIYHGSELTIKKPSLEFSSKTNDYGVGFYCTEELDLAKEWACRRGNNGFVSTYQLDTEDLEVLDLSGDNENVLKWIAILMRYRLFKTDTAFLDGARGYVIEKYGPKTETVDVIKGYRADDSYFQYAEAFIENRLPVRLLNKALKLGKLGMQTALVSQKAIDHLTYCGAMEVSKDIYYPDFLQRDTKARDDYRKMINSYKLLKTDIFLYDIIREEMDADDPRIQRSLSK